MSTMALLIRKANPLILNSVNHKAIQCLRLVAPNSCGNFYDHQSLPAVGACSISTSVNHPNISGTALLLLQPIQRHRRFESVSNTRAASLFAPNSQPPVLNGEVLLLDHSIGRWLVTRMLCTGGGNTSAVPSSLWRLGRLNHIAIAVPDLEKATAFYRDVLGASVSVPQALPEHGVTTVFVELDNTKLELLLPLGDKSPIQKFLEKNKSGGLHHVCIEVDDIKAAMAAVSSSGVRCLTPQPKTGAHGKPVVFLHPQDCNGVLLELEEA